MSAADQIDKYIADLGDWRGDRLRELRNLINGASPDLQEDWKWDTPVWTGKGNVCSLAAFKEHVKINFFRGASLPDPHGLFNSGLEAKKTRSIDLHEGDAIDEDALRKLVQAAASGG